jgi:hypothetical protein
MEASGFVCRNAACAPDGANSLRSALVMSLGAAQRAAEATAFSPNEAAPARAIGALFRQ